MRFLTSSLLGASLLGATPLLADSPAKPTVIEEVSVTAQHRQQRLQEVPMALSVFDSSQIDTLKLQSLQSLTALTPGLTGFEQGINTPLYAIRGISSNSFGVGGEASVGVFLDESYIGRINSTGSTLLDIERIEVLKGPQGTLFGRNSTAGTISLYSHKPQFERSGSLRLSAGEFETRETEAMINLPLSDKVAIRIAALQHNDEGYERNEWLGTEPGEKDGWSARFSLRAQLSDDLEVIWSLNRHDFETGGLGYETTSPALAAAGGVPANSYDGKLASDVDIFEINRNRDSILRVNWQLNDTTQLSSISAYHRNESPNHFDVDGSALFLFNAGFAERESTSYSQEFRLTGSHQGIDYSVGVSHFQERVSRHVLLEYSDFGLIGGTPIPAGVFDPNQPAFNLCDATSDVLLMPCSAYNSERSTADGDYESNAIYADATWPLSEQLSLITGLRYTRDEKRYDFNAPAMLTTTNLISASALNPSGNRTGYSTNGEERLKESWDSWQPRVALQFTPTEQQMLYLSLSHGYKAGGFDPSAQRALSVFDQEEVINLEVGGRFTAQDRRWQLGWALYRYDYENYQVQVVNNAIAATLNVPEAEGVGAEFELTRQMTQQWRLTGSLSLNKTTFSNFITDDGNLSGNRPIHAPQKTLSLLSQYEQRLSNGTELLWSLDWSYRSEQYFTIMNTDSERQAGYALTNLSVTITPAESSWALTLRANNLFDKEYTIVNADYGAGRATLRGAPRWLGADIRFSF